MIYKTKVRVLHEGVLMEHERDILISLCIFAESDFDKSDDGYWVMNPHCKMVNITMPILFKLSKTFSVSVDGDYIILDVL